MKAIERALVRARRDKAARARIEPRHVEFCTECGKACDRTGRRNMTTCHSCSKERRKEAA